jgi:hypothetical protein
METLSQAVERLASDGYGDQFQVEGEGLRARDAGRWMPPEELVCDALERFEGASDPDDETILFALRTRDGDVRGTLTTRFGPGIDPAAAEIVQRLPQPGSRPESGPG